MSGLKEAAGRVIGKDQTVPGFVSVNGPTLRWTAADSSASEAFAVALHAIKGPLQRSKKQPQMRVAARVGDKDLSLVLSFSMMDQRDKFISDLTPLLAKASEKKTAEPGGPNADIKKLLLQENSDLRDIYDALVKGEVISDAEFWKNRQDVVARRLSAGGGKQQTAGLSSALLAQLQPAADGKGKQITMTVTPQFIQQVFAEKPHVHRAFVENVPQAMDEKEFWTRFAKHEIQMQNRNKPGRRNQEPPDPLFSRLTTQEAAQLGSHRVDPTLNLSVDQFDRRGATATQEAIPHGRGEAIARDMNRHSAVVLEGPAGLEAAARLNAQTGSASHSRQASDIPTGAVQGETEDEIRRRRNRQELEDLQAPEMPAVENLEINNPRRYFEKTNQDQGDTEMREAANLAEVVQDLQSQSGGHVVDPREAERVLLELEQQCQPDTAYHWSSGLLPKELIQGLQSQLRQHALVCNELLSQFWSCIPFESSVSRERSATKLRDILDGKYTQLEDFGKKADSSQQQVVNQFLRPIFEQINAALESFQVEVALKTS